VRVCVCVFKTITDRSEDHLAFFVGYALIKKIIVELNMHKISSKKRIKTGVVV
jgi:hypothetical protein